MLRRTSARPPCVAKSDRLKSANNEVSARRVRCEHMGISQSAGQVCLGRNQVNFKVISLVDCCMTSCQQLMTDCLPDAEAKPDLPVCLVVEAFESWVNIELAGVQALAGRW